MAFFSTDPDAGKRERWDKLRSLVKLGIEQFRKVGRALKEIRDSEIYKLEHATWEQCCRAQWDITPQHAGRLIDAALLADELEPIGSLSNEHQARQLLRVPVDERADAWQEAIAEGGTPAAIEKAVSKRARPRRTNALRKLRIKVPGGVVIIEPNRRATTHDQMLSDAVHVLQTRSAAA